MLETLELWIDEPVRDGFANMAVDDWLLDTVIRPVLRIYAWEPGWGSFGYFVADAEASEALPGLRRVRRRTGGGIVDHRHDWTYTLVVPTGEPLADLRGGESYRYIHAALAVALEQEGHRACLAADPGPVKGGECFARPAAHDLLDAGGRKIAGAGQRRSGRGLLHQGSVAVPLGPEFGKVLAAALSGTPRSFHARPDETGIRSGAEAFRNPAWAKRR